jgi:hypothetical protein
MKSSNAQRIGPIMAAVMTLTVAVFATSTPIGGGRLERACAEYNAVRAAFLQGEIEFERRHGYRSPLHPAVYRAFEPPDVYLARVSTAATHAAFIRHRDDCARWLAAQRKVAE